MSPTHVPLPHPSRTRLRSGTAAVVVALVLVTTQLAAAAPGVARLTLTGPPSAVAGSSFEVTALLRSDGAPLSDATVQLERQSGTGWTAERSSTTDEDGVVTFVVDQRPGPEPAVLRAAFAGDGATAGTTSEELTVPVAETAATLALTGPEAAVIGHVVELRGTVRRADDGAPLADVPVRLERRRDGGWVGAGTSTTGQDGRATWAVTVRKKAGDNRFRAVFAGTPSVAPRTSEVLAVDPVRAETELRLGGPARVVDETTVTLTLRWRAGDGREVPGVARLWSRVAGRDWQRGPKVRFGKDGAAEVQVGPRVDTRYRAVGGKGSWWRGDRSEVHRLDNVPPGDPVSYPSDAPKPRVKLPRQPRAVGNGPNAKVTKIPNAVWNQMTGRSWHSGCPVGRSELRLVRINYWGYDGYRYRGELVVRDDIARQTVGAFSALYRARLPIRSMYRVDRFGWSSYLHGGNNYESMAAGNTSGFNCRGVVGNPSVPSPHSYGRAIDVNTWENPYHSKRGWTPNTWWASHSHPRIAWRSGDHPVVRIMRAHGFRWTYGTEDSKHFDG